MSGVAHHLVRRALDITNEQYANTSNDDDQVKRIAIWGMLILWATGIIYTAMMAAISYTYGDVIATLAMIETPTATAYTPAPPPKYTDAIDQKTPLAIEEPQEPDLLLAHAPITAKLRTAVHHLRRVGGRLARFRGFHIALLYNILHAALIHLFTPRGSMSAMRPLIAVLATIALCRLQMTWTHHVISAPRAEPVRWYKRFPSIQAGKNILLPTAVWAVAQQAAMYVPAGLFVAIAENYHHPEVYGSNPATVQKIAMVQMLFVGLIWIGTIILVVIPAQVTMTRVMASMLPEEDEPIVPFDRSFAGKVTSEQIASGGAVNMLDAWKTFDKQARLRLVKLYVKVFMVQVATTVLFAGVLLLELRAIVGANELPKLGRAALEGMKGGL